MTGPCGWSEALRMVDGLARAHGRLASARTRRTACPCSRCAPPAAPPFGTATPATQRPHSLKSCVHARDGGSWTDPEREEGKGHSRSMQNQVLQLMVLHMAVGSKALQP
eukprot:2855730-Pleurochrysis_carterae.AAC.3